MKSLNHVTRLTTDLSRNLCKLFPSKQKHSRTRCDLIMWAANTPQHSRPETAFVLLATRPIISGRMLACLVRDAHSRARPSPPPPPAL